MDLPKLIALDLDGTLLPESKQLSRRSRRTLRRLQERGVAVTLATGKFLHLAQEYGNEIGLSAPLIALDGARIRGNGGTVSERGIPRDQAERILEDLVENNWSGFVDDGTDHLLLRAEDPFVGRISRVWAEGSTEVDEIPSRLAGDPAVMVFYGPPDDVRATADQVRAQHPGLHVSLYHSVILDRERITLQPEGINKGQGVHTVLSRLGFAPEECMVFGDWHNDMAMFEAGFVNVAMANAIPELKRAAHHITDETCENDGVADFLEKAFL